MDTTKRLKASEITEDGYYWCSHQTSDFAYAQQSLKAFQEWHIVYCANGAVRSDDDWTDDPTPALTNIPDYIQFVGPLEAPQS